MSKLKRAYFILNVNQPTFDSVIDELTAIQRETWPNNILSVRFNKTNTQACVKCGGITPDEFDSVLIQQTFSIPPVALMRSAAWVLPEEE